jgi:DNA repair ATPase RecN
MARYIDAEHLMQKLSRMIDFCEKHKVSGLNALFQMGDAIMDCPTADVAPKSEVAIEIIQDIAKACAPHDHHLNSLDFEIGYITAMNQVLAQLEEIKKKYTEEHT